MQITIFHSQDHSVFTIINPTDKFEGDIGGLVNHICRGRRHYGYTHTQSSKQKQRPNREGSPAKG